LIVQDVGGPATLTVTDNLGTATYTATMAGICGDSGATNCTNGMFFNGSFSGVVYWSGELDINFLTPESNIQFTQ
jgi:hypothetical protein